MVRIARCARDGVVQLHCVTLALRDEACALVGSQFLFQHKRGTAPFPVRRALRLLSAAKSIAYLSRVRKRDCDSRAVATGLPGRRSQTSHPLIAPRRVAARLRE